MAKNLVKAGHEVRGFDLNPAAVKELQSKGGIAASSPADAAGVDAVITMLPSSPHVKKVYEESVFGAAAANTLLIDCSTIDPNTTKALAAVASAKKFRMVDAPVSGGVGGAEAGTLTFMVGGAPADFDAAKVFLSAMGRNIVHTGPNSTGQIAKIVNNLILGISMNAVSEAFNLGVKLGADPSVLAAIVNTSSGRCWSSEVYNPVPGVLPNVPASRGYTGGFQVPLMAKDLGLALDAAKAVGAPLSTGAAAHAVYQTMMAHGQGHKDFSSVYEWLSGSASSGHEKK
jgi:3-hydroxyisobutyrate dehydrogenase